MSDDTPGPSASEPSSRSNADAPSTRRRTATTAAVAGAVLLVVAAAWWWFVRSKGQTYEANGLSFEYPDGWLREESPTDLDQLLGGDTLADVRVSPEGAGDEVSLSLIAWRGGPPGKPTTEAARTEQVNSLARLLAGDSLTRVVESATRRDVNEYEAAL
jgi:hypothetical protein